MKNLKKLARFVANQNLPLSSLSGTESKFFELVCSRDCDTDHQALRSLYGKSKTTSTYRALKFRLRERLLDSMLHLEISSEKYSEHFAAEAAIRKRFYIIFFLWRFFFDSLAYQLTKKLMEQAHRYQITDIELECAKLLQTYYCSRNRYNDFETISREVKSLTSRLSAENDLKYLYQKIRMTVAGAARLNAESLQELHIALQKLNVHRMRYESHAIQMYYFRSASYLAQAEKRHQEAVCISDEALVYFRTVPHLTLIKEHIEFLSVKGKSFLKMHDPVNARFAFLSCLRFNNHNQDSWFIFQSYAFILALHLGKVSDANETLQKVFASERFKQQNEQVRELWELFKAYLFFIYIRDGGEIDHNDRHMIKRWNNSFPMLSRKRQGWNIALTIIQALFRIITDGVDDLDDHFRNLNYYAERHLNKAETYRSMVFIRMLVLIPKEQGDYNRVEKLARKWLQKLRSSPSYMDDHEIIPYERLWTWVLQILAGQKQLFKQDSRGEHLRTG